MRKDTLVICDDVQEPATLDPQKEFSEKNHTIIQQIYEGLVRFDSEGMIIPVLATSWQQLDPTHMQFKLRKNVRFHNGEIFDAQSVKSSLERYLAPDINFPGLGFINSIKKIEILDQFTVDIVTHYPDGLLLHRLASFVVMVPPSYATLDAGKSLSTHPIGTGPFRFISWKRTEEIDT